MIRVAGFSVLPDEIADCFAESNTEFEVCVPLYTNIETMPVEDLAVRGPEEEKPYQPVAKIVVERQATYSPDRHV